MSVYSFLSDHPKYEKIVEKIYKYEKEKMEEYKKWKEEHGSEIGWEWHEVGIHPTKLIRLVEAGILKIVYKSRSHTEYRLTNFEEIRDYFEVVKSVKTGENIIKDIKKEKVSSKDLFKYIVGYDDLKKALLLALNSPKPVHILMIGPPATAKSLFLEDIYRIYDNTEFVIGSTASSAGLFKILKEKRPRIILIDEIDKILSSEDLSVLLSVMESGILRRVKGDEVTDIIELDTRVIAAGNSDRHLPRELKDRFLTFYLKEYNRDQFMEICENYLSQIEGSSKDLARYIAEQVWSLDKSIRTARSIARMCNNNKENVDFVIELLKRYNKTNTRW